MTDDPDLRIATSLVDYVFRKLAIEYLPLDKREEIGVLTTAERMQPTLPGVEESTTPSAHALDLPMEDRAPSAAALPQPAAPVATPPEVRAPSAGGRSREVVICHVCGDIMQRAGVRMPELRSGSGCSTPRCAVPGSTQTVARTGWGVR
jgi:ribonucleoside-diphosphate reductase alpha chain